NQPVIVADLRRETRFSGPPLLHDHGVVSGLSVIVRGRERPYGVLGAHTTRRRLFTEDDGHFLQAVANVVGAAIERGRADEEVRRLARRNRLILNSTGAGIYGLDAEGRCTFINPAALNMLGYTAAELAGRSAHEVFHHSRPDGSAYPAVECPVHQAYWQGRTYRGADEVYWRKDGRPIPVEYVSTPIMEDGKLVGAVVSFQDITARKEAEEALRRSNAYNRSLIEASLDPLVTIGPDGKITDVNAATEAVTGRSRQELIGTDFSDYFTEPARARAGYEQVFREGAVRDYELAIRHRDGRITPVLYNASVYRDEHGEVIGVYAVARDITSVKRAEEALHALNMELEQRVAKRTAQLEAAVRELEDISYSVSHDLWIPLRAVDGFAGILLTDYQDALDEEGKRLLTVIRTNTKRMARLLNDILTFLRLGRTAMTVTDIDMEEIVRAALQDLESMTQGRDVRLEIKPLPRAQGDRALIRQVFVNLLSNALKFTQPTAMAVIEVGAKEGERTHTYYVRDNGVGFDMRYADKLFGVFQRLHGVEEFEGTGMGLAIAHRIITRHGGRLWAEGSVNEGATFHFTLPKSTERRQK
ncbi:MAG: PAS domain S-box protein, partial [Gammaproteobacteria bacterium]